MKLAVDIGGTEYILTSDDTYLEYIKNGFEPDMVELFKVLASESQTILDIGANIGCTALLFSQLAEKVYAFEPSPSTFEFLTRNTAEVARNVFQQNYGIGEQPGKFDLSFSPANRSGAFIANQVRASANHKVEEIEIRRLDEVISSLQIQDVEFIKIDVEGFEASVLKGASNTLASFKPLVTLEVNHWCLNAFQRHSIPDFLDFLRSIFPILYAVDGESYLDIHDESDSYVFMYHHILHMRYQNIVAAFDRTQVALFESKYQQGFNG